MGGAQSPQERGGDAEHLGGRAHAVGGVVLIVEPIFGRAFGLIRDPAAGERVTLGSRATLIQDDELPGAG
ncbi:hypothetical protein GCM10022419_119630 [Nonomuraea rosea]|uniref:Uncharacterized protein n=1 Tax=Nonomuraea rosea TaxID=638574 RepID=A0ABP6ZRG4_9ACTN